MSKIRKAIVGAAGAFLAVVAQALQTGSAPDWKAVITTAIGAAVVALVAVWGVPNATDDAA